MDPVLVLLACAFLCLLCASALLVHHKLKHSIPNTSQHIPVPKEQWFQFDDLCALRCTHENWIMLCVSLLIGCLMAAYIVWRF